MSIGHNCEDDPVNLIRAKPKLLESAIQIQCVRWFKYVYKKYADDIYSIPNGSKLAGDKRQRAIQAKRLEAEGLLKGASDLCIAVPIGEYHGMYIEMKSESGTVSSEQKAFLERRKALGYYACVCYSGDDFEKEVRSYFSCSLPSRAECNATPAKPQARSKVCRDQKEIP